MAETETDAVEEGSVEALRAALERERARVREIDHRANNNLQLVSALLMLFGRRAAAPETQQVLKAMQQRIGAIAAAQRAMLRGDADRFDLTGFVRDHVAALVQGQGGAEVRLELEPVDVAAGKGCPCALIVNELVLNALKHGVRPGGPAAVTVRLQKAGEGFRLAVEDHGPGLPTDAAENGFGVSMVTLLARQVAAQVAWEDAQPGLRAVVTAA